MCVGLVAAFLPILPLALDTALDAAVGFRRTFDVNHAIFLAFQIMVIDEKFLQFTHEFLTQVPDMLDVCVTVICLFDGDDAVIALALCLALPTFDDPDDAALQQAARESRLIHQNEHVSWIAVASLRGRDKAEVVGKRHACGKNPG